MSKRKGSEEIPNDCNIEPQESNTETKITIENYDVKMEISCIDEEARVLDFEELRSKIKKKSEEAKKLSEQVNLNIIINNEEETKVVCDDTKKELSIVNLDNFIDNNEKSKVSDCEDVIKKLGEANLTKNSGYVFMAYAAARPDGLLVGRAPQSQNLTSSGDSPRSDHQTSTRRSSNESSTLRNAVIVVYTPEGRNRLIRFILSCVFVMLLVTAAFLALVFAIPVVKEWFKINTVFLIFPILFSIMMINYAMSWYIPCTRRPPGNILCLVLTVISMSLLSAVLTSYFSTDVILYAFIATTAVVFVCIILATTNFDFTSLLLYFIVILTAFLVLAAILMFIVLVSNVALEPTFLVLLIGGTLIQVLMLTMNLQMIIGGKTIELNENDYALGAYMVYMAIIDIFLKMVYIIGLSREM
ncbi:uncharacterized protein LOC128680931 [Plodia interpunctella]|uniref:uncharacterized protein LOC128680931 n=1 Tax=Plodia interpunctella TaxID=58824 RepID=UPI002368C2B6|nr:uncharacterized protein LOC128680931 [Plodia interpunctella]